MEIISVVAMGVVCLILISMVVSIYQKCPPNQAMIVYGGMGTRIIKSGGCPVWPMIEQRAYLSLEAIPLKLKPESAMIAVDGIPVLVEVIAQIKVMGDDESIKVAAEQFLGKSDADVASMASTIVTGHLRAIVGTMKYAELSQNIDGFMTKGQEQSAADLHKMGLTIVTMSVKELKVSGPALKADDQSATIDFLSKSVEDLTRRVQMLEQSKEESLPSILGI